MSKMSEEPDSIVPIGESNLENSAPDINEDELEKILKEVPEEHRKTIERTLIASSFQMRGVVSPENAVLDKITGEHITEYLKGAQEDMKSSYREKTQSKVFIFFTLLMVLVFVCAIIILLKDNPEVMEKIIYALIGLVAGAFGGYGVGKSKSDQ